MTRFLLIAAVCFFAVGCQSSKDDPASETPSKSTELNPTANALEGPPGNGSLPADLRPPV